MKKSKLGYSQLESAQVLITAAYEQCSSEAGICSSAHIGNVANAAYYVCLSAIAGKS